MFFNEPEDIKFLHVVNRQQRRPSPLMQDRPTLNFDPENEKSFRIWKQKWDSWLYMVSSEEGFIDSEKIFHFLISCFSDTTMTFVFELGLNEMEARNPDMIIQGLSNLLSAGKNHHLYRYEFNSRVQLPGEGFDTWLASLRALMHFSKFESDCCSKCGETRLLQQIVCGVNKPEVRKVLLEIGPGLSLDQASRIIKKSEYLNNETFLSNAAASRFQNSFNEQPIPTEFQSGQDLSEDIVIPSGNTDNLDISSEDNDIAENNVTVDLNDTQPSTSQNMRETLINEEIERNLLFDVKSTNKTQQSEASKNLTKTTTTEETFEENLSQTDLKASQQKQAKLIPQTEANLSAQNQPDNKSSSKKQTEPKLQAEAETESVQENPTENRSGLESHYIKASTEIQGKPSMTKAATEIQGKPAKTKASSEIHKNLEQNATKAEAIAEKMTTETEAEAEDSDIKSVINKKIVKKRKSEIKTTVEESVHIKTGTKRKAKTVQKSSQSKKKSKTAESFSEKAENVELPMMDAANENLLMNVEVKSELANYQCVSCGETFSTFYQRKLHLCGNRNLLSEFGVCIICEDRQQISFMDDFGRCGNCQDDPEQEDETGQLGDCQMTNSTENEPTPSSSKNKNKKSKNGKKMTRSETSFELEKQNETGPNQSYEYDVDFGEVNLEQVVLETIDALRKKRQTSSVKTIVKKVLSKHPNLSQELVAAQIALCQETGLIQKLSRRNSISFALVNPLQSNSNEG